MSFEGSQFFSLRVVPSYESQRSFPVERRDVSVLPYKVVISLAAVPEPREKALTRDRNAFQSGQFKLRKRTWNVSVIHARVIREVWSGVICEYVVLKTIKLRRGYKLRKSGKRKRLVNFRLIWSVLKLLIRKLPLRVGLRNLSRFKSTSIK